MAEFTSDPNLGVVKRKIQFLRGTYSHRNVLARRATIRVHFMYEHIRDVLCVHSTMYLFDKVIIFDNKNWLFYFKKEKKFAKGERNNGDTRI